MRTAATTRCRLARPHPRRTGGGRLRIKHSPQSRHILSRSRPTLPRLLMSLRPRPTPLHLPPPPLPLPRLLRLLLWLLRVLLRLWVLGNLPRLQVLRLLLLRLRINRLLR